MSPIAVQLLSGGGIAALTAIVTILFSRKKTVAETEEIAAETYRKLNQDLLKQLTDAKNEHKGELAYERAEFNRKIKERETYWLERSARKDAIIAEQSEDLKRSNVRINELETRVNTLEGEIKKYQDMGVKIDELKETAHAVVEVVGEGLKDALPHQELPK